MAKRTTIPGLELIARSVLAYVGRNRTAIDKNLNPQQKQLLDALLLAIEALIAALPDPVVNP